MPYCFERQIRDAIEVVQYDTAGKMGRRQETRPYIPGRTVQVMSLYNRGVTQIQDISDRNLRLKIPRQSSLGKRVRRPTTLENRLPGMTIQRHGAFKKVSGQRSFFHPTSNVMDFCSGRQFTQNFKSLYSFEPLENVAWMQP